MVKFCSVSSDHVLEALLNTTVDLDSLELDSVLEDQWIKEVVKRSGMKFRWAKLSASKEKINRDARPRYASQSVEERAKKAGPSKSMLCWKKSTILKQLLGY